MRIRSAGNCAADRLEDCAAREHEIGALDADAAVGGALGVAHRPQPRDRGVDFAAVSHSRRSRAGRSAAD